MFLVNFTLTPKIGFQTMSLVDFLSEVGLSMGGYLTITNKDNIAIFVKVAVSMFCEGIVAKAESDPVVALEMLIKGYLYFKACSLTLERQNDSKNLEGTMSNRKLQLMSMRKTVCE